MNYKYALLDLKSVKDCSTKFETIKLNYERSIKNNIDYVLYYAVRDRLFINNKLNNVFDNLFDLTKGLTYE